MATLNSRLLPSVCNHWTISVSEVPEQSREVKMHNMQDYTFLQFLAFLSPFLSRFLGSAIPPPWQIKHSHLHTPSMSLIWWQPLPHCSHQPAPLQPTHLSLLTRAGPPPAAARVFDLCPCPQLGKGASTNWSNSSKNRYLSSLPHRLVQAGRLNLNVFHPSSNLPLIGGNWYLWNTYLSIKYGLN